ncbi:MAG TPA: two-component regulator propeller domain-containing protein, partial [Verrucomicrobiae bacterium]|nr:two-component regulator propeller domain-containing protein [Verrucomicrobiae bacterium]
MRKFSPADLPEGALAWAVARAGGMWLLLGRELIQLRHGVEAARRTLPETPGGVWSMSEDSRGNVWIATHDQGICQVRTDNTMLR